MRRQVFMGQVTVYLDEKTTKKMKSAVKKSHISQSRWLSQLIQKEINSQWPRDIEELAGAWNDFPSLEEIRSHQGKDMLREEF